MSVANRLYGFSDAPVEGVSPFWGTLEVGAHDTLQMLSAFTWAVGNRTGSTELTERAAEAFRAEEQYGQQAISELGYGQQKLLAEPIGLANFSPATLGAQLLRNAPSMLAAGAVSAGTGLVGGALTAGALGTGDAMSSIVSEFGNLTPEDAAQIPYFKKYIDQGMSPEDALQAGIDHAVGNQDILQMALQTGLGFVDPAVWLGRMARGGLKGPGLGRIKTAAIGAPVAAAGGAIEEGAAAYTQNVASERTEGLVPETSVAQAALAGAILEGPGGAVAGFMGGGKPWEVVEPGQLDQNEQIALTEPPAGQLALPPPGGTIQQPGSYTPPPQIGGPPAVPQLAPPVPGETIMQPGRTAQPTMIRDRNARPPATVTPDVIEQPGQVGPVPQIAPPGGRPASLAPDVIPLPNRPAPPTMTPEQVEQSVEDYRQNAIQNGAPEGPDLDTAVESYRNDLLAQLEEEAAELQERPGAIQEEANVTAPVTMRDVTREFLNQNGVSNEAIARMTPEQVVEAIVQTADEQLRLRGGMTPEVIEQRLEMIREQATDEIVNGNIPIEEEGELIEGEAIPTAPPTAPEELAAIPEALPEPQAAPPARPRGRRATTPTPEIVVPEQPPEPPPERQAQPTVIREPEVAQLSPAAAASSQRIVQAASEEELAQEAARARPPITINPVTISELFSPIPERVAEAEAEGPITLGLGEQPEGQTIRRGGETFYEHRLEQEAKGEETREDSALRKELDERYPEFKGRTDLSVAQIIKRVDEDPVEAAAVLEKNPPAPGEYAQKREKGKKTQAIPLRFVKRLERILKQAKARDITLPKYVTATTADPMVWLADVQRTLKQLHKNLTSEQSLKVFGQYISNEAAALDGDFEEMRGSFGREADIGGTMPGGGGPIETLAGGMQAASEEEAEAREIAEAAGEDIEEAAPIVQTYDPGSEGRAMTVTDPYIYVRDEETGVVKRTPNPVAKGYVIEATEAEKQAAIEAAPRAAELTRLRHDKSLKMAQDVKGQKAGRSGKGVSAASEEEYIARPGKKISSEKAKKILAEEGKKPMTKKAREEARRKLAESKAELERKMATYRETVTRQEEPAAEQQKEETPKEKIARVRAKREAEREQKRVAAQQAKERKAGKEPVFAPKETFEEKRARIFAEIAARRDTGERGDASTGGRRRRPIHDEAALIRQADNDAKLAHTEGAVEFYGRWVKPLETLTMREAVERVRMVGAVRGAFSSEHDKLVDRILQMLMKTRPNLPVYVFDEADVEAARGNAPRTRTNVHGFFNWPDVDGSPHFETGFIGIKSGFLDEQLLAHEGIHAITNDMLATFPALRKQLEQILAHILMEHPVTPPMKGGSGQGTRLGTQYSGEYYGLKNVKEMLSEISNYDFAELLHSTTIPRSMAKAMGLESWKKATGWNGFVAAIRKYFNQMLGIMGLQPITDFNAFDAVLSTIERSAMTYDPEALADYQSSMAREGTPLIDPDFLHVESEFRRARERVQGMDEVRQNWRNIPAKEILNKRFAYDTGISSDPFVGASVNVRSAAEIAREAARSASYTPGKFRKFFMKLRSGDNIMRQFEHLFPTDTLRRAYSAYMRRYTLAQQMHGVDAKFMTQKNNLFNKYKDKKIGNVTAKEFYEDSLHDQSNWNVDASKALKDNTWLYNKAGTKINLRSIVSAKMHTALQKDYDKLAREAPELASLMQKEFKYYKDKHQRMVDGILTNHIIDAATGQNLGPAAALALGRRIMSDTATPADVNMIGKRNYDRIRATPEFRAQQGPYIPQMRYGDYVVSAKVKVAPPTSGTYKKVLSPRGDYTVFYGADAEKHAIKYASNREEYSEVTPVWTDASGNRKDAAGNIYTAKDVITGAVKSYQVMIQDNHTEFFESEAVANSVMADLKKDSYYQTVNEVRLRAKSGATPGQELAGSKQLKSILDEMKSHDPFDGLPTQVRREAQAAVQQAIYRATPGTSISKRRMQRKHVAGASRDSLRVMHSYSMQANNFIAGVETAHETYEAFKAIEDYAQANLGTGNITAQTVVNELSERRNAQAGIHGGVAPWVNFLTGMQFTDKLASPGYSITNMTQTPLITMPILAKEHGLFNAGRALTKAMHDIGFMQIGKMATKESWAAIRNRLDQAVSYHDFVTKNNPSITGNRKAMLDKLVEYGSLDPDAGFEATKTQKGKAATNVLKRVEDIFRQFPRGVEAMNRYGSAIAAYDLAIKKGKSHAAAIEYARDTVDSTQFNYSPANVSPYFNTAYGNIGLQFAKYGTFMYQLLGAQVSNAFGPTSSRAERLNGAKGLAYLIGAHWIMAGFGGLPHEPVRLLFTGLNMMGVPVDWNDVESWVRDVAVEMVGVDMGEALTRGLPRMVGLDFSTRTSLGDLLLSRPPEDFDERQNIGAYLWQLTGGPTGSSLTELGEGIGNIIEGNYGQGLGQVIPIKLFTDIESAIRISTTGKKTSGREVIMKYDPVQAIMRSLGIRPAGEANLSEARNTAYRRMEAQNEGRADVLRDFREAPVGEQWKFQRRFDEYNAGKPRDQWITFSSARKDTRAAAKKNYQKGVPVTKGNEQIMEDILRTFGAD